MNASNLTLTNHKRFEIITDYDAPISEAGWPTPKFYATRALFSKYLLPGESLPPVPATNPVVNFAPVQLNEVAPVFDDLPPVIHDETPRNMEAYDQGYGCTLYRTTIPAGPAARILLPARGGEAQLDFLVEPMGRINFGTEMADRKGLIAPVKLGGEVLKGWEIFKRPLDDKMVGGLKFTDAKIN